MHPFVRDLITEWRRLALPFELVTTVVAVSGGADSVSLLLGMHELVKTGKLSHRLVAAHFNHALRGAESDADEEYVRQLTSRLGVELAVHRGHVSHEGNLEQNARRARYAFLRDTARNLNAFAVLTGHTMNDQAETFLMNLIRGSGPAGLRGMEPIRIMGDEKSPDNGSGSNDPKDHTSSPALLVRPLLRTFKRSDTEVFCHDQGVEYRYDTMNEDTAFKRVRIRKILLPLLEDMNPNIVESLVRTASLMPEPDPDSGGVDESLSIKDVKLLDSAERFELIRLWLRARRGSLRAIQLKHVEAIDRLLFSEKSGRLIEIPGGGNVVRSRGKLMFRKIQVEKPAPLA